MAPRKRSSDMRTRSSSLADDYIATLKAQLAAKDVQLERQHVEIAELQKQLRMVMEDKFYRPVVTPSSDPEANKLHGQEFPEDVERFDEEKDKESILAGGDIDEEINRQIDAIAEEHGFVGTNWSEEHKA